MSVAAARRSSAMKPLLMISVALAMATHAFGGGAELPKFSPAELKAREAKFSKEINFEDAAVFSQRIRTVMKEENAAFLRDRKNPKMRAWGQILTAIGVTGENAPHKSWKPVVDIYRPHMIGQDGTITAFKTRFPDNRDIEVYWEFAPKKWGDSNENYDFKSVSKGFVTQKGEANLAIAHELMRFGPDFMEYARTYPKDMLTKEGYYENMAVSQIPRTLEAIANWIDAYSDFTSPATNNKRYFTYIQECAIKRATVGTFLKGPETARQIQLSRNSGNAEITNFLSCIYSDLRADSQASRQRAPTPGGQ